jgi:hypothetical protein
VATELVVSRVVHSYIELLRGRDKTAPLHEHHALKRCEDYIIKVATGWREWSA